MDDLPQILKSKALIVHKGIKEYKELRFERFGEHVPLGLKQNRYFACFGNAHNVINTHLTEPTSVIEDKIRGAFAENKRSNKENLDTILTKVKSSHRLKYSNSQKCNL